MPRGRFRSGLRANFATASVHGIVAGKDARPRRAHHQDDFVMHARRRQAAPWRFPLMAGMFAMKSSKTSASPISQEEGLDVGEDTGTPVNLITTSVQVQVYRYARQGYDRPEVIGLVRRSALPGAHPARWDVVVRSGAPSSTIGGRLRWMVASGRVVGPMIAAEPQICSSLRSRRAMNSQSGFLQSRGRRGRAPRARSLPPSARAGGAGIGRRRDGRQAARRTGQATHRQLCRRQDDGCAR